MVGAADPATAAGRWRLDFEPGDFSHVVVAPKLGAGKVVYYLPYTLTNGSDADRTPRVRIEVRTGTKKTFGDHFDAAAYAAIGKDLKKKKVNSTFDLRASELGTGKATEAAAHFGRMDDNADDLEVRVYGLWDPVYTDNRGKTWSENRVLVLKYHRAGDEYKRYEDPIKLVSRSDEIEGERVEIVHPAKQE